MARASISLAALVILLAVLLGTVLGGAPSPSPSPLTAVGMAPAPAPALIFSPSPFSFGPAPPPGPDCSTILLGLADCLTYVEPGSNLTKPDKPCCSELADLVASSPYCLCKLLGDPSASGFTIDVNRALELPTVCNVSTPDVSLCAVLGVPVSAPTSSTEAPSPSGTAPTSSSTSPSAPDTSPTKPGNGASRSVLSAGVLGATILASIFF